MGSRRRRELGLKTLPVELTAEARGGWDRLAANEGVTLTGLCEAVGLAAQRRRNGIIAAAVFAEARRIDRARHSRR